MVAGIAVTVGVRAVLGGLLQKGVESVTNAMQKAPPKVDVSIEKGRNADIILAKIRNRIENRFEPHNKAGKFVVDSINFRMNQQIDETGTPWPKLEDDTIARRRFPGRRTLDQTRTLKKSIKHEVIGTQRTFNVGLQARTFGTLKKETVTRISPEKFASRRQSLKARTHQTGGGRNIPARPFIGLSSRDRREIARIFGSFVRVTVQKGARAQR